MPSYVYNGHEPRVLFGLRIGFGAEVEKLDGTEPEPGTTVVVSRGDRVHTAEPYSNALLVPIAETAAQASEEAAGETAAAAVAPALLEPVQAAVPAPAPQEAPATPPTDSVPPAEPAAAPATN